MKFQNTKAKLMSLVGSISKTPPTTRLLPSLLRAWAWPQVRTAGGPDFLSGCSSFISISWQTFPSGVFHNHCMLKPHAPPSTRKLYLLNVRFLLTTAISESLASSISTSDCFQISPFLLHIQRLPVSMLPPSNRAATSSALSMLLPAQL